MISPWCLHVAVIIPGHPPRVGGQEDVVVTGTVAVAGATPDEHHLLAEDVPLGTVELHLGGDGGDRRAAAAVGAQAAKLGLVEARAVAAGQLEAHALLGLGRPHTLFTLLWRGPSGFIISIII